MVHLVKPRLWNLLSSGLPQDSHIEALRKVFLINLIIGFGSMILAALCVVAFVQGDVLLGISDFVIWVLSISLLFYLRNTKNYALTGLIGTVSTGLFFVFLIAYGGVSNTAHVWAFTYPLISLFLNGSRRGTWFSMILLIMVGAVFALGERVLFLASYPVDFVIRFIPAYLAIYLFALVMEKVSEIVQSRLKALNVELEQSVGELEKANTEKEALIHELRKTMKEVKTLQGIMPICANCKKIRNDSGYWEQVEKYIQDRSKAQFSHGLCPECARKLYPDLSKKD